jgi:regulator of protease activity HflC (stomatin/prohibitin superfamily)
VKLPKTYHAQPINNDAEIEPIDWEAELQQLEAEAEAQIQRENQEREAAKLKAQDRHQSGQTEPAGKHFAWLWLQTVGQTMAFT